MIRDQLKDAAEPSAAAESRIDSRILHTAWQLDRRLYRGKTTLEALRDLRSTGFFDPRLLDTLNDYQAAQATYVVRRVLIRDLRPGMILDGDATSQNGNMVILKEGTVLTETWIDRLSNFKMAQGTKEPLGVRVHVAALKAVPMGLAVTGEGMRAK
jgi:hypothetical protein